MFDISLKCQWEVGCGAGGLKVGPVIKFIRSDRLPMRERDICCYGQNPLLQHYHHSLLGSMRSTRIIEDICIFTPSPPTTWDQNHWTLSYLNWNWFPFLQEFWLWTFSGGAVLMSEPSLIPRGKKISTRTGKIYYYQNTLSPTQWNIS